MNNILKLTPNGSYLKLRAMQFIIEKNKEKIIVMNWNQTKISQDRKCINWTWPKLKTCSLKNAVKKISNPQMGGKFAKFISEKRFVLKIYKEHI